MFLGGNTSIPQGGAEVYTLDRNNLGLIAATKGDGYFKDSEFWREVLVTFKKTGMVHGQRKTLRYTKTNTAQISFTEKAMLGDWHLKEVCILDKDGGRLVLTRADIPNINLYDIEVIGL